MGYLSQSEWKHHPILSRTGFLSDFDGDGVVCLHGYQESEFEACSKIEIEYSDDSGATWRRAEFENSIAFIDHIGAGWAWLSEYHPYEAFNKDETASVSPLVRAKLSSPGEP
jgi:hypothetical protein